MQRENLRDAALYTGYDLNGGYAQYMVADARYAFLIPEQYDDAHAAPLLCAGLIGYRAYAMTGDAKRIGLYGYGAAAHIIAQIARHEGREVFSFTRRGDTRSQQFALALGAAQNPQMFQTGWFLESLLSQTLVVHVIRTGKIPFMESRPSLPLLVTTISICLFGLWLPASPLAHALGLTPMPYAYFAALLGILMAYLLLAQCLKTRGEYPPRMAGNKAPAPG